MFQKVKRFLGHAFQITDIDALLLEKSSLNLDYKELWVPQNGRAFDE